MSDEITLPDAYAAQQHLREALALGPGTVPMAGFVNMIGDEIEAARKAGHDDAFIAGKVSEASGVRLTADDIAKHYQSRG